MCRVDGYGSEGETLSVGERHSYYIAAVRTSRRHFGFILVKQIESNVEN